MKKNTLSSLIEMYNNALKKHHNETPETIEMLKEIVQGFVLNNDDASAYIYQKKVCDAYAQVLGEHHLTTKNAGLYCRELMIRSSPLSERVRLCRDYWQDAKREYGENSYLVRILAPLYLMCCSEANEIEELKIVCSEITEYFGNNDDDESRELVALCSSFDIISGEKSGSIDELNSAVLKIESVYGKDSLMSLHFQNEIGYIYKKSKQFDKAADLCRNLYLISAEKYGRYSCDTIVFQKNYVMNLALSGKYRKALSEAKVLQKAAEKCPEKNRCPDINECFMYIYMALGKNQLADKYGKKSVEYSKATFGKDDATTAKANFISAAKEFSNHPQNRFAFENMMDYMTVKERRLNNLFLLSSDITREKVFDAQNRGEFDCCLGLAISNKEYLSEKNVVSLWEIICNYKSLIGDCELLHSAISRNPEFSVKENELIERMKSENPSDIAELQRQILDITRAQDFTGYVNSVHVSEIQKALKEDELLLDYYCVHYSDLQTYVCIAVTSDEIKMLPLSSIDEIDLFVDKITTAICNNTETSQSRVADDIAASNDSSYRSLVQKLSELLNVDKLTTKKLIVCPDGELYRMPFDILFDDCEVVYVTNAKDIVRDRNNIGSVPAIKDVYVFADPLFYQKSEQTYTDSDEQSQERSEHLARLPGTYIEANIISRIFGNRVQQFTGENASRDAFLENCNGDILHIGSHATAFDGGKIYLSGADDNDKEHPGYVTSRDIAKLDMAKTKLAVLSACQTGIGEYRNYLGVRGLRRAFHLAGTKTVLSTLWNISDLATSIFMYAFYSKFERCSDSMAALHYAKNYMKTATVKMIKGELYSEISDILIQSGNMDTYRELRDIIGFGEETETPFSSPYYWAAFSLFE